MFKQLPNADLQQVSLDIEGQVVSVPSGHSVAAAAAISGICHCRTTALSGERRAPYCMMGVCFECLMEIDGIPNQQACLIQVREGMQVRRQNGARGLQP